METEIELKFFVSPDFSEVLQRIIAETKVLQHRCRQLGNTYFDSADHWLRQHDIGMRIRRIDDVYVQTVKTSGRVVAGLHQRPEYNAEHTSNQPNLTLHPEDIWPQGRDVSQLQQQLIPLFSTNFTREQWLISVSDGSQIEVAFDQGMVEAGSQQAPICEVELELKSGQIDALFQLARQISEHGGVRLGNLSKAAVGYRLATGYQGDEIRSLMAVDLQADDSVESCFVRSLEHALAHWHYHEQIYVESQPIAALHEIAHSIAFIRQLLSVFAGVVPRRASAILRQELKWLDDELAWLRQHQHLDNLLKDKAYALRKLDAQKWLISELKQQQAVLPDTEQVLKLLHSARYTELILDLSRWVLTRGWQPFLDEKASLRMAAQVTGFARQQLDRSWSELLSLFSTPQALEADEYIAHQYYLLRSLYTGVSFARLYDQEQRLAFRMPWVDLLHGIDDLLTLETLAQLITRLPSEAEQEQLLRWLNRQQSSILHAMEQTRQMGIEASPYWCE